MSSSDLSCAPQSPQPSPQALEQAAEWFALLRSGEARDEDRAQWQRWLDSAQENDTAWRYVEQISRRFEPVRSSPGRAAAARGFGIANTRMARRRQALLGLGALAGGSGLLAWAAWRHTSLPGMVMAWTADYRTATGEVRNVALSDGTQVWLSTASAFDRDYRGGLRRLRLVAGEILIQTAADPDRPFVVDTPQGGLRALGTRFAVRLDGDVTVVAVFQGAVEARPADAGAMRIIQAGEQTRFTGSALAATQAADRAREAWTRGILIVENVPLADVARELQRYRGGHLGVAPEVAGLRVAGSYPATDPDRALAMLESVLPIRVRHTLPWWVGIEPRQGAVPGG